MTDQRKKAALLKAQTIITRRELWHNHYAIYYHAKKDGYLDDVNAIIDANKAAIRAAKKGYVVHSPTTQELHAFVAKYTSREAMKAASPDMYFKAIHRGLLTHLPRISVETWTPSAILVEALKYQKRGEFCRKSQCAYKAAKRQGILDDVCKHMPKPWNGKRTVYRIEKPVKEG